MFNQIHQVYFIGIGGIGMSALARYFKAKGCEVCGYDRTETTLTRKLAAEGIIVHYSDNIDSIPITFKIVKDRVLVVYTPAVPDSHTEMQWFRNRNYLMMKRSEVLGLITKSKKTIAVAGTHGKTSVSTMTAHLLTAAGVGCDAFLGGISKNYNSNLLLSANSRYMVAEADEYDRSFLWLHPYIAVVTATDADHLEIYGTHDALKEAFAQFVSQITPGGTLIAKFGLNINLPDDVRMFTYSLDNREADFHARDIHMEGGRYMFTLHTPYGTIENVITGVPGLVNVENSIAAIAAVSLAGADMEKIKAGMASFEGVQRRFDYRIRTDEMVYIDDYAHHPEELRYTIESLRNLYPDRQITGIFQPHLFTRTRDFADEFAQSLSLLDSLILLDIYPAREEPIEGVSSKIIFNKVTISDKQLCAKGDVINILNKRKSGIYLTLGAGDIDTLVVPIEELLKSKIQ